MSSLTEKQRMIAAEAIGWYLASPPPDISEDYHGQAILDQFRDVLAVLVKDAHE